ELTKTARQGRPALPNRSKRGFMRKEKGIRFYRPQTRNLMFTFALALALDQALALALTLLNFKHLWLGLGLGLRLRVRVRVRVRVRGRLSRGTTSQQSDHHSLHDQFFGRDQLRITPVFRPQMGLAPGEN